MDFQAHREALTVELLGLCEGAVAVSQKTGATGLHQCTRGYVRETCGSDNRFGSFDTSEESLLQRCHHCALSSSMALEV